MKVKMAPNITGGRESSIMWYLTFQMLVIDYKTCLVAPAVAPRIIIIKPQIK